MNLAPCLGIDIGGTKTRGVVLGAAGDVLAECVKRTGAGPDGVIGSVLDVTADCLRLASLDVTDLGCVGVGIPGRVEHRTGVVSTAVNLGIARLDLAGVLASAMGVQVRVENDVKATALGAAELLGFRDGDLTYLNLGTGIASATLVAGRLLRGQGNLAGEIGHVPVDPSAGQCACGQDGCLEVLAGGAQITRRLSSLGSGITLATLIGAASAGDRAASAEANRIAGALATAVQLLVLVHGSPLVVLGGGVVHTAPGLLPLTARVLDQRAGQSEFLASLRLSERIILVPASQPVAAIGAALVARSAVPATAGTAL